MSTRYRNILDPRDLWGTLSLLMSLLACYGTLGLVGLLSALGMRLAVNEGIWAGAILLFAWATEALVALGARAQGSFKPAMIGLAGAGLLTYTLLVDYRVAIEISAFALLAIATGYDFRLRRRFATAPGKVDSDTIQAY